MSLFEKLGLRQLQSDIEARELYGQFQMIGAVLAGKDGRDYLINLIEQAFSHDPAVYAQVLEAATRG